MFSSNFGLTCLVIILVSLMCNQFHFLGMLILSENLNLLTVYILLSVLNGFSSGYMIFLCFLVVATVEITLALVVVSRLNCESSLFF